jgi:hypothetical protein
MPCVAGPTSGVALEVTNDHHHKLWLIGAAIILASVGLLVCRSCILTKAAAVAGAAAANSDAIAAPAAASAAKEVSSATLMQPATDAAATNVAKA